MAVGGFGKGGGVCRIGGLPAWGAKPSAYPGLALAVEFNPVTREKNNIAFCQWDCSLSGQLLGSCSGKRHWCEGGEGGEGGTKQKGDERKGLSLGLVCGEFQSLQSLQGVRCSCLVLILVD